MIMKGLLTCPPDTSNPISLTFPLPIFRHLKSGVTHICIYGLTQTYPIGVTHTIFLVLKNREIMCPRIMTNTFVSASEKDYTYGESIDSKNLTQ